jgi:hypothetical protein
MPLAALPYACAWLVWSVTVCGFYGLTVQRLFQPRHLWPMALGPCAAINLLIGQNGLLSTALMATGVLLLPRRPVVAGVAMGFMAYKPHLALLAPLALLFGREWRALAAAMASEAMLILFSAVTMGPEPWIAFLHKTTQPAAIVTSSSSNSLAIPSVMVLARSLGISPGASSALHWAAAAAAAAAALWVWNRSKDTRLRAGALAAATLLITPYLRPYDLALLTLPIAALAPRNGDKIGSAAWVAIAAAWAAPALLTLTTPRVQYGALITATMMGLVLWRCVRSSTENAVDQGEGLPEAGAI